MALMKDDASGAGMKTMKMHVWALLLSGVASAALTGAAEAKSVRAAPVKLDMDAINAAAMPPEAPAPKPDGARKKPAKVDPGYLKAQVLLDRQRFSPGAIDGKDGENFRKALSAFQQARNLPVTGNLDRATWDALSADQKPVMTRYEIKASDLKGPFVKTIPAKLEKQAELDKLAYKTPREMFAEKFHVDEDFLARLNPKESFKKAGDEILVPDVERVHTDAKVGRVEIDKEARLLRAFDPSGALMAAYPASIGSEGKPAPSGSFKITAVAKNPVYHYDPKFAFKGVKTKEKFTVAAGPNNPVGAVWIDLSEPTYGIHGTPEPSRIGRSFSHGCVRLTNWDALDLAGMVKKGVDVVFDDTSPANVATGAIASPAGDGKTGPDAKAAAEPAAKATGKKAAK
jgi:lipoprotein-anchoring transpeptidase ErfK/SrfK